MTDWPDHAQMPLMLPRWMMPRDDEIKAMLGEGSYAYYEPVPVEPFVITADTLRRCAEATAQ